MQLRRGVLDALADVIAVDGFVWLLTDPVTTVGAAPLADVPGLDLHELPALVDAKYSTARNRWTMLMRLPSPVGVLDNRDEDEGRGTAWRELLTRLDVGSVASVVFADEFGCWGFLDLWRSSSGAPFDAADGALLAALAPTVTAALRECQARTFIDAATPQRQVADPVVLTLDDRLRITSRTSASRSWLDRLLPPEPGGQAVPASVYNVAAQLRAIEAGVDDHPASTRVHLDDGFWLTLRAARMGSLAGQGDAAGDTAGGIVVTIEEASAAERLDLFSRAFALTPRECELVGLLATGADTRAMARGMALSEHTVQDHLKSVFAKTGAHDRVTVLSRALGTRGTPSS